MADPTKGSRYANVTATLALVLALGGTSYAVSSVEEGSVGAREIASNAVRSRHIQDGQIVPRDLNRRFAEMILTSPGFLSVSRATPTSVLAGETFTELLSTSGEEASMWEDVMISSVVQVTNTSSPGSTGKLTLRLVNNSTGAVLWSTAATINGGQTATVPLQAREAGSGQATFKLEAQSTGGGMVVERGQLSIIGILIAL